MVEVKKVNGRIVRVPEKQQTLRDRLQQQKEDRRLAEQQRRQAIAKQIRDKAVNKLQQLIDNVRRNELRKQAIIEGRRKGGSRGIQIANNRIAASKTAINFLTNAIDTGNITQNIDVEAQQVRDTTIRTLEKKRKQKFTPGSSLKKVTVKKKTAQDIKKETEARRNLFERNLQNALKGSKPNSKELFKLGLTGNEVTKIILTFEERGGVAALKDLKTDKFFERLENKRTFVDKTSQTQAFKIAVNQQLKDAGTDFFTDKKFKELKFDSNIKTFQSELERLNKFKDKVNKLLTDDVKKQTTQQIKARILSAEEKARTGQSMTPKELEALDELVRVRGKNLNIQQLNLGRSIVVSPVDYANNLGVRKEQGEKSPFFKDVVAFSKGLKAGAIDPLADLAGLVWTGAKWSNKTFWDYAARVATEGKKGNFVLDDDIIKVGKLIISGAKTTAQATAKVSSFVKANPKASALIVGAAAISGFNFIGKGGEKLTRLTYAKYKKSPSFFLGQVVGLVAGVEGLLSAAGKTIKGVSTLSPKFAKATEEGILLKKESALAFSSVKNFLKNKKQLFKQFTKDPNIFLKFQTVKSGAKPLSEQAILAGQEVLAVNASANRLTSWIKTKQIIRKPIPGEADFPKAIKAVLKKFDDGTKLTKKEFASINKWLQKNVAPNITLLERSLYADPAGGLRLSRLGIKKQKKASLKDIFNLNFTLRSNKPQVLIFENAKVAKFPKALNDVKNKLKAGKKLTESETNRLIAWQVKTGSGKFKPIGSTIFQGGKELEVTLAPGEFIKRIKRIGFTYINGKKVDFVTAEVYKPTKAILEKIKKAKEGKLTSKELKALEKELGKKLGRKIRVESPRLRELRPRDLTSLPVLRLEAKGLRVLRAGNIRRLFGGRTIKGKPRTTPRSAKTKPRAGKGAPRKTTTTPRPKTGRGKPRTGKGTPRRTTTTPRPKGPKPRGGPKPARAPGGRAPPGKGKQPPKLPSPDFDSTAYKNKVVLYEATFRERIDPKKPTSKRNKIITKTINIKDTRNRALQRVANRVDRSLARSITIKAVKITDKKFKDIPFPPVLRKFSKKKSRNTPVLKLVEDAKFAFDKRGEVKEAKKTKAIAKITKPKAKSKKKTIKKVKVVKKNKKVSNKPSKKKRKTIKRRKSKK